MDTSPKQKTVEDVAIILLKEGISQGRHPEFQVVSNSMYPVLKIGDKISVKETPLNKLSCGDIVVYKLNQRLIAHRFLYLNDSDSFVTQGDNTSAIDQPIDKENLLGKITLIEKKDIQINLENKLWRYTNFLVGRAFMKKAQTLNKNTFIRLLTFFESRLLKIIARITNPVYGRISKKEKNQLALEKEFLKVSSRKELTENDINLLKSIANQGLNWDWVCILAEYNSIAPLIYINLSRMGKDFAPEETLDRLKYSYTESFLKTAPIYDDISKLLKAFNAAGIKAIILKGCSFAELLYEDFSLRPMKDVDILVKKGDWQRIKEIIARLGFQSESEFDILKLDTLIEIPVDWQLGFENNRGTKLEFKFYLYVLDFPIFEDTESYFKEAAPAVVAGVETLSLSIEDQILLLCCRLINVGFRNLLWFCDLREFLEHYRDKINWEKLIAKAKKKRITVFLYFSFLILKEQLAVGIAQEVINSLKPNFFRRWMFEYFYSYKSALFRIPQDIEWPNPLIGLGLVFGKIGFRVKNLTKALVYFKKLFFPAKEYIAYRYEKLVKNHSPKYFYYLRIKRLLSKLLLLAKIITEKIF